MPETSNPLEVAERCLLDDRRPIDFDQAMALAELPLAELPGLVALSHRVLLEYCGDSVELESIISAKTGACPEDCTFCSQSTHYTTEIDVHPMVDTQTLVDAARATEAAGGSHFCIVIAVKGPDGILFEKILDGIRAVRSETGVDVACSLGLISLEQAERLVDAGVSTYNHNLEAARSYFPKICTTHTYDDRLETCRVVMAAGMELCSGGIIGMGETLGQRIELAFELRATGATEVPINFLNPRPGTPLETTRPLEAREAVQAIALFRLVMPEVLLRYAGGREDTLRELQSFGMYAGINGLIIGNYLTTTGRSAADDLKMLADLGRPVSRKFGNEGIITFSPGEAPRFIPPGDGAGSESRATGSVPVSISPRA